MFYKRCLFITFVGALVTSITGIAIMPQTGGAVPMGENPDTFYENQRKEILNSTGFKLAMAGAAITILILVLLVRDYLIQEELEDAREARRAQVIPYPRMHSEALTQAMPQVKPQAKPQVKPQAMPQAKPQAMPQVKPQAKKLEELREVIVVPEVVEPQHVTHELLPPKYPTITLPPRMILPPRAPMPPFRTFKYPPPYEAFNKK